MQVTEESMAMAQAILDYHSLSDFKSHDQNSWIGVSDYREFNTESHTFGGVDVNICNTTMCAAGTAVWLDLGPEDFKIYLNGGDERIARYGYGNGWSDRGATLLGLDYKEANYLFGTDDLTARTILEGIAKGDKTIFDNYIWKG